MSQYAQIVLDFNSDFCGWWVNDERGRETLNYAKSYSLYYMYDTWNGVFTSLILHVRNKHYLIKRLM